PCVYHIFSGVYVKYDPSLIQNRAIRVMRYQLFIRTRDEKHQKHSHQANNTTTFLHYLKI
ncbi:hypothetical protein K0G42_22580, partial [Bacteroides fragilis]|nr:hypothetical protein [Bacteroides fragilis]MCE9230116.1 hypothetical protein [Bacteroides fragilis]